MQIRWQSAQKPINTLFFTALRSAIEKLSLDTWPTLAALNTLAQGIKTQRGIPIEFVSPTDSAQYYEAQIAECGQISTRENWHDLFNALAWIAFPQTKAIISERHVQLLNSEATQHDDPQHKGRRSASRDVLTLFDESGMVVLSEDPSLLELITQFQWKTLFWECRADVAAHMRFYLFGHGVMEKCLEPYLGMIAKSVCFAVPDGFLSQSIDAQIQYCDARLAQYFLNADNLKSTRDLTPIPILGILGWDTRNVNEIFYDNTQYFRPGYSR